MNTVRSRRDHGWGNKSNPLRAITCAALPRLWGLPSPPLLLSEEDLTDSLIPHGVTQFFKRLLYQTYHSCSRRLSYMTHDQGADPIIFHLRGRVGFIFANAIMS